jgi:hypothetical protein
MMRSLLKEGLKYKKSNIMSESKGILIGWTATVHK